MSNLCAKVEKIVSSRGRKRRPRKGTLAYDLVTMIYDECGLDWERPVGRPKKNDQKPRSQPKSRKSSTSRQNNVNKKKQQKNDLMAMAAAMFQKPQPNKNFTTGVFTKGIMSYAKNLVVEWPPIPRDDYREILEGEFGTKLFNKREKQLMRMYNDHVQPVLDAIKSKSKPPKAKRMRVAPVLIESDASSKSRRSDKKKNPVMATAVPGFRKAVPALVGNDIDREHNSKRSESSSRRRHKFKTARDEELFPEPQRKRITKQNNIDLKQLKADLKAMGMGASEINDTIELTKAQYMAVPTYGGRAAVGRPNRAGPRTRVNKAEGNELRALKKRLKDDGASRGDILYQVAVRRAEMLGLPKPSYEDVQPKPIARARAKPTNPLMREVYNMVEMYNLDYHGDGDVYNKNPGEVLSDIQAFLNEHDWSDPSPVATQIKYIANLTGDPLTVATSLVKTGGKYGGDDQEAGDDDEDDEDDEDDLDFKPNPKDYDDDGDETSSSDEDESTKYDYKKLSREHHERQAKHGDLLQNVIDDFGDDDVDEDDIEYEDDAPSVDLDAIARRMEIIHLEKKRKDYPAKIVMQLNRIIGEMTGRKRHTSTRSEVEEMSNTWLDFEKIQEHYDKNVIKQLIDLMWSKKAERAKMSVKDISVLTNDADRLEKMRRSMII